MTPNDLERLEGKIKAAESAFAKSEGGMEQIADRWEKELGTRDPKEVEAILEVQKGQLRTLQNDFDTACSDAQVILDRAGLT